MDTTESEDIRTSDVYKRWRDAHKALWGDSPRGTELPSYLDGSEIEEQLHQADDDQVAKVEEWIEAVHALIYAMFVDGDDDTEHKRAMRSALRTLQDHKDDA